MRFDAALFARLLGHSDRRDFRRFAESVKGDRRVTGENDCVPYANSTAAQNASGAGERWPTA